MSRRRWRWRRREPPGGIPGQGRGGSAGSRGFGPCDVRRAATGPHGRRRIGSPVHDPAFLAQPGCGARHTVQVVTFGRSASGIADSRYRHRGGDLRVRPPLAAQRRATRGRAGIHRSGGRGFPGFGGVARPAAGGGRGRRPDRRRGPGRHVRAAAGGLGRGAFRRREHSRGPAGHVRTHPGRRPGRRPGSRLGR